MPFTVKDVLKIQVAPALGCTEPVAIALGAAAAASVLENKKLDAIEIWVDPNIYKNGLAVSIPGTEGLKGLDTAAAIGAFGGNPELRMEVLDTVDEESVKLARELLEAGKVKVNLLEDHRGLYIKTIVKSGSDEAESVIRDLHDQIVSLTLNGEDVTDTDLVSEPGSEGQGELAAQEESLKNLSLVQLFAMVDELDENDLQFLKKGLDLNLRLSDYGLKNGPGLGVGMALNQMAIQKTLRRDMVLSAKILTAAAADARMAGVKLPAMSSGGSGNHGLTATLPIKAVGDYLETNETAVLKAIGFSHIITAYVKAHTGRLTALCGCSIAAGAGAAAGITYLLGGSLNHVAGAIKNISEDLAGVICDGAKDGCAFKLSTAAGSAVQAALFALQGVTVMHTDGIIGVSSEDTMKNIGTLATIGMVEADRTILKIMLEKQFSDY